MTIMTTANPALPRDHQAPFTIPFSHAANADGGDVITKLPWSPDKPYVVDRVAYLNVTGLAGHASNYGIVTVQKPQVIADHVVASVDLTDNELEFSTPHLFETGDGPIRLTTTGGAPTGLATGTDYWAIDSSDGAVKLAASLDDALRGTAIDITGAGTGVHTLIDQSGTKRILAYWATDSDLAGTNDIPANTSMDLTLNSLSARQCDANDKLEVLVSDIGTTTIPTGSGMVQGRWIK